MSFFIPQSNLICVGGLPASGKTTLANFLAEKFSYTLIDDCDIVFHNTSELRKFSQYLRNNRKYILTDPNFVSKSWRDGFESFLRNQNIDVIPQYVIFSNSPAKCKDYLSKRTDQRLITGKTIDYFSRIYSLPNQCLIIC